MDKIKQFLINLGSIVAILAMVGPIITIYFYENFKGLDFWVIFIISILYDVYMYSIIKQTHYIEETKELFENVFNGKIINSNTEEEKLNWYKVICINMFMDYFSKNKKK